MHQQVVVTTDAPAALKPLLASAIQGRVAYARDVAAVGQERAHAELVGQGC
jgi:hypothetical protein